MIRARIPLGILLIPGLLAGCSDRPPVMGSGGSSSGGGPSPTSTGGPMPSDSSGRPGDTGAATGSPAPTTTGLDSTSSDDGVSSMGFICNVDDDGYLPHCTPDGGVWPFECDMWAQDCPEEDEKCMPWANDGGNAWNATRCSPVSDMPGSPGDECTVEGSAVSGIDTCDHGSMCWRVDPETNTGECVALCGGNEVEPQCGPGTACGVFNGGAIVLCLPECDPLASTCGEGRVCVPNLGEDYWVCAPSVPAPAAPGDDCEFVNACEDGSVCADSAVTPSCAGPLSCCTPLCDLGAGSCADMETSCVSWHSPDPAPPGQESLGICVGDPMPPKSGWTTYDVSSLVAPS